MTPKRDTWLAVWLLGAFVWLVGAFGLLVECGRFLLHLSAVWGARGAVACLALGFCVMTVSMIERDR